MKMVFYEISSGAMGGCLKMQTEEASNQSYPLLRSTDVFRDYYNNIYHPQGLNLGSTSHQLNNSDKLFNSPDLSLLPMKQCLTIKYVFFIIK